MNPVTDIDIQGYAAFGQATYTLFNRFHLTGGLRYDHQDLDGHLTDSIGGSDFSKSLTYNEFLPKASVSFDLTDDAMTYAGVSKGYMVGGFNYCLRHVQGTFTYDPEYTMNYEVELKISWLNHRLNVNLAAFYIKSTTNRCLNWIRQIWSPSSTTRPRPIQRILNWKSRPGPEKAWTYSQSSDIQSQPLMNFLPRNETMPMPHSYKRTIAEKTCPMPPGSLSTSEPSTAIPADFSAGSNGSKPTHFTETTPIPRSRTPIRPSISAWDTRGERYYVVLWCKNLFDEEYLTYVASSGGNYSVGVDGIPQMFGLTVTYRF